jgi:hypothetical protein
MKYTNNMSHTYIFYDISLYIFYDISLYDTESYVKNTRCRTLVRL